jgi:hypothetical protein
MKFCGSIAIAFFAGLASAAEVGTTSSGAARHWAFLPVVRVDPPAVVAGRPSDSAIDAFVGAALHQKGFAPSPDADAATLVRRVHLDLTGFPPNVDEVDAFLADTSPGAYERMVDRLLASPHFGERWARWWLDLCGYADSDGYLSDFLRPNAWLYRQWVVDAFNANIPFDEFTVEQLAGDLVDNATMSQKMGTGFLRNTLNNREGGADLEEFRVRQIVARTSMMSAAWMGLTVGCAECHDHKFDPVSQKEFYQLYAFFNNGDEINVEAPREGEAGPYAAAKAEYDRKRTEILAPLMAELAPLEAEWEAKMLEAANNPDTADHRWARTWEVLGLVWGQNFGEGQHEGIQIVKTPRDVRTLSQTERLFDYFLRNGDIVNEAKFKELKIAEVIKQLDELAKKLPPFSRAPAIAESLENRRTHIHRRGDFRSRAEEVSPGTPAVLGVFHPDGDVNRLDLAKWLVSPENPLTARVTVNRIWQELFGRGLVFTSEDFGTRGTPPSHPELLDWLASEFIAKSWNFKALVREIVLSSTYRQASKRRPDVEQLDPNNTLLARQARLRLPAELVRDSALSASGLLNPSIGGPSVRPPQPDSVSKEGFDNKWVASEGADRYRRGLYTFIQRTSPFAQYVTFDLPDNARPCTRRDRSNTPLQALNMLNDPVFVEAAQSLAARAQAFALGRMRAQQPCTARDCIEYAFRACLARRPNVAELDRLETYLNEQAERFKQNPSEAKTLLAVQRSESDAVEPAAWVALCSVILNLDEFVTRE